MSGMHAPEDVGRVLRSSLEADIPDIPTYTPATSRSSYRKAFSFLVTGTFILLFAGAVLAWPAARAHCQALAVLMGMNGNSVPLLLRFVADRSVKVEEVTIDGPGMPLPARLYRPSGVADPPALVMVHGLHYLGMDSPDLTSYARRVAACGILVLTPDLIQLREDRIDTASIDAIGAAARWLAARAGAPVGLIAMSFSGGASLIAAARPENAASIKFVFVAGTYDDLARVITAYATLREPLPDGTEETMDNPSYGPFAIEFAYMDYVVSPQDRAAVRPVLLEEFHGNRRRALKLESALTAPQQAEIAKLQSPATLAQAAIDLKRQMDALSPHNHLAGLRAPVFLLSGSSDPIIPPGEADWLAQDLPSGTLRARLTSPVFDHAKIGTQAHTWKARWDLVHFFAQVVEAAEAR